MRTSAWAAIGRLAPASAMSGWSFRHRMATTCCKGGRTEAWTCAICGQGGAVVDREGYPVGYEVLAGNVRDHKTVAGMLQRLGARFGLTDRTLCMDRGMVTQDSLKLIRESTVRYVLADRRGASEQFPEPVQHGPWQTKRAAPDTGAAMVEVQEVGEDEGDRLILVRSRGCAQKEKGIQDRMLSTLKTHLERLQTRWARDGW